MKWGDRINTITNKASKTLLLRRNLKIGNKKTKETAYKALVRPMFEYAATFWIPYTEMGSAPLRKSKAERQDGSQTDTAKH